MKLANDEITICSVDYQARDFLVLNRRLVDSLNPANRAKWVVVDNNPLASRSEVRCGDESFMIVDGPQTTRKLGDVGSSAYHGAALNESLSYVDTRYLLILDPDFYILRPDWIRLVLSYMQKNDLSILGAPWHPKWFMQWRYFPCTHCLFIDLDKVDINKLDFTPPFEAECQLESESLLYRKFKSLPSSLLKTFLSFDPFRFEDRYLLGYHKDTGYKLLETLGSKREFRIECLTPVFNPSDEFKELQMVTEGKYKVAVFGSQLNHFLERFLPDSLCFIPKRNSYFRTTGFKELGYFDARSRAWEEFFWQGQPFGFHIRRLPKVGMQGGNQDKDLNGQLSCVRKEIEPFLDASDSRQDAHTS